MAAIDTEACASEQALVSESHVHAPRFLSKRALVIGGIVALGFVAAFLHNKPHLPAPGNVDEVVGLAKDGTCAAYTCPEGLVQLLGSRALKKPSNDANCCDVCPRGWQPLGKKGDEAPGWGLSELGSTAPSMSNCANACKANADCFSFKWHHATKNCIFMSVSDSTVQAQTSKWDNVITCVEAVCTTTGLSTSGAGEAVPCKFPFRYKSKTYHNCTSDGHNNMNPAGQQLNDQKLTTWCATETQDGEAVAGKWGHCSEGCNPEKVLKEVADGMETEGVLDEVAEGLQAEAGPAPRRL